MLLQIDGWYAGGKGVLWSLLEGHKDVFVCPVHDYSFAPFFQHKENEEWLEKKYSTILRQILSQSEYYKFEKIYHDRNLPIHLATNISIDIPYKTDFYDFDSRFMKALHSKDKWTLESIVETLYKSFMQLHAPEVMQEPKYYASMSHAESYPFYTNIPTVFPNMKTVVVKRKIHSIIASRTNRQERPRDLNSKQVFRTPFNKILKNNEIEKICDYFATCESLQKALPERFKVVAFEDLIHKTELTMRDIAKFLEIDFNDILLKPTRDGVVLEKDGISFIGDENDSYKQLLSAQEIKGIDRRIKYYNVFRQPFYFLSVKSHLMSVARKLKRFLN